MFFRFNNLIKLPVLTKCFMWLFYTHKLFNQGLNIIFTLVIIKGKFDIHKSSKCECALFTLWAKYLVLKLTHKKILYYANFSAHLIIPPFLTLFLLFTKKIPIVLLMNPLNYLSFVYKYVLVFVCSSLMRFH